MARHPILSEQLYRRLIGLFSRDSRRTVRSRGRRAYRPADVTFEMSSKTPPAPKSKVVAGQDEKFSKGGRSKGSQGKSSQDKPNRPELGKFWLNLFWSRPWLLVAGLWLTFVLMIAIALVGLSSPGREMVLAPVDSSVVGQPLSTPDAAAVSRLIPRDEITLAQRDPAATLPSVTAERSMPMWPLLVMVVACAGGCMVMSNQGLLNPESRRGRRRAAPSAGARSAFAEAQLASARTRLSKRQRRSKQRRLTAQRPASQVMSFRSGQPLQHTAPRQTQMVSKPVSFAVDTQEDATSSVTVVPNHESSHLDWKEGSLAHRLDVRQTRSIRSFL